MVAVVRESERKYEAPDGELPDLTAVPGVREARREPPLSLDALYHDTTDGRLAADGITLRRRTGGSDPGWHLKLPVAPGVRDELREPLRKKLPGSLAGLVRSRVRGRQLVPVLRLRSERAVTSLLGEAGELLAEVAVDTVRARRQPDGPSTRWTEIEVELAAGQDSSVLDAVDACLTAHGIRPAGTDSKLERAMAETAEPAERGQGPGQQLGGAGAVVLGYVRRQVAALVQLDTAVRRDLPDSVHRMRVATRRLRSCFRSYRKVLDPAVTAPLGEELRWLAAELGVDRDREVLAARLRERLDALPAELRSGPLAGRLRTHDRARKAGSRRRLLVVLDSERHLTLLERLTDLVDEPPLLPAATRKPKRVLRRAVRRDFDRLAARVGDVLAAEPGSEREELTHRARKAAKRARYATEVTRPVFGKQARKHARRLTELQELLGTHQDTVVTRAALREIAAEAAEAGEPSFSYGVLYEREVRAAEECAARLPALWRRVLGHGTL